MMDGFSRRLEWVGVTITDHSEKITTTVEEVMEIGIPLFLVAAIIAGKASMPS
ncbi:MAG: hypothetical protein SWH68_11945 [Thermodesulfobacteriota bacterium]|nr:hypothetical protein [Thermodesulfobacteriota bacterium]